MHAARQMRPEGSAGWTAAGRTWECSAGGRCRREPGSPPCLACSASSRWRSMAARWGACESGRKYVNSSRRSSWSLKRLATCSHIDSMSYRHISHLVPFVTSRTPSQSAPDDRQVCVAACCALRQCKNSQTSPRCGGDWGAGHVGRPEAARLVVHLLDALLRLAVLVEDLEEALVDVLTRAEALLYFVDVVYRLRAPLLL